MRHRTHEVSWIERLASFATATGATAGTLVVLTSLGQSVLRRPVAAAPGEARQVPEHLVYVETPEPAKARVPVSAHARRVTHPQRATTSQPRVAGVDSSGVRSALSPHIPDPGPAPEPSAASASAARVSADARGVSGGFRRPSHPVRIDSALGALSESLASGLASGRLRAPSPTQEELDTKWRDQAFEVAASRASGVPVRQTGGGSIPVPLPFGGPSRKQRERDRAIEAQLKPVRALRQQRVDSVVAARRERRADSLARVTDSLRPPVRR